MLNSNKKPRSLLSLILAVVLAVSCLSVATFATVMDDASVTVVPSEEALFSHVSGELSAKNADECAVVTSDIADEGILFASSATELTVENRGETSGETSVDPSDVVLPTPRKVVSLSPNASSTFDKTYYEAGTVIDIYANWTPTSVKLKLGVLSASSSTPTTSTVSGGEGSVQVTIRKSGYFSIYVENTSASQSVNARISYAY